MAISDVITSMNQHTKAAYDALEAKGAELPQDKNLENLAGIIENLPAGGDYGTVTIKNEDGTTTDLPLDLSGFLAMSRQLSDNDPTITIGGVVYQKEDVTAYDTGDNLDTLLPYMFSGSYWDNETFETKYYWSGLESVRLGANIKTIPGQFMMEAAPTTLEMVAVETIGDSFLSNNSTFNAPLIFPDTLTTIGNQFMSSSNYSQPLTIPASVTSIGESFMSNANQFTELTVETTAEVFADADPYMLNYVLATWQQSAPMFTTGVTISGAGAEYWRTSLPNRFGEGPYRKIIGNPVPEPYVAVYTADSDETPAYTYYDSGNTLYFIRNWDGRDINGVSPNQITRVVFGPDTQQLPSSGLTFRFPSSYSGSENTTLKSVSGLQYVAAIDSLDDIQYFQELESIGELSADIYNHDVRIISCPKFNQPFNIPEGVTECHLWVYDCAIFNSPITLPSTITSFVFPPVNACPLFNQPISIPDGVVNLPTQFLAGCTSFNQPLTLPDSVQSIGENFLSQAAAFNSPLTLNPGLQTIGHHFLACSPYQDEIKGHFNQPLEIPSTVTTVGTSFMAGQADFTQPFTVPSISGPIGSEFMYGCDSFIGPLTVYRVPPMTGLNLCTNNPDAPCYTTGVTIVTGEGSSSPWANNWVMELTTQTTAPYRKVINGDPPEGE